ncbi:MAG: putative metal-dependent phosphoesterase TrpH [Saprospiraceae bacterium]
MIDLHTHSTESDGTLSPTELVSRAAKSGIKTLALTDHDCVSGLEEARAQALLEGIQLIDGIELSVLWSSHTIHIVGLGIDPNNQALQSLIDQALEFRAYRAQEISKRLEKVGIENAYEGAKACAKSKLLSRAHFAQFLVEIGHAKDLKQVFKRYMVPGKPGYVVGEWVDFKMGIDVIKQAGGVAVVAHPARYKMTRSKLRRFFQDFKDAGGEALEVVSGSHSRQDAMNMTTHVLDFDLAASVGSDYHGPEKQWIQLGRMASLPQGCNPVWELPNLKEKMQHPVC